jgi:hypothetical protein
MRWVWHVACTVKTINVCKIMVGKPERKITPGIPRYRWKDNISMNCCWAGKCGLDSSGSGQGPVEGSCEHDNERLGSIKSEKFLE